MTLRIVTVILDGIKMIVNNEYIPSLRSHDNLRNAMIIHEILSQPVCKRRKKR